MNVPITSQLSQYEIGDISAGDLEFEIHCITQAAKGSSGS